MVKDKYNEDDRRSGLDRRIIPPQVCVEVCKPLVNELANRDVKLAIVLDKTVEKVKADITANDEKVKSEMKKMKSEMEKIGNNTHKKLDSISDCIKEKIPSKLFWRVVYGFSILIFGICGAGIVGTLWSIYGIISDVQIKVVEVRGNLSAMSVTVQNTAENLKSHLIKADRKYDEFDHRLDKVEKGETFFNFYNKQHKDNKNSKP